MSEATVLKWLALYATSQNSSPSLLRYCWEIATKDVNTTLLELLAANPNLPAELDDKARKHRNFEVRRGWLLRPGRSEEETIAGADAMRITKTMGPELAQSHSLPAVITERIALMLDAETAVTLLSNPNLSQVAMDNLAATLLELVRSSKFSERQLQAARRALSNPKQFLAVLKIDAKSTLVVPTYNYVGCVALVSVEDCIAKLSLDEQCSLMRRLSESNNTSEPFLGLVAGVMQHLFSVMPLDEFRDLVHVVTSWLERLARSERTQRYNSNLLQALAITLRVLCGMAPTDQIADAQRFVDASNPQHAGLHSGATSYGYFEAVSVLQDARCTVLSAAFAVDKLGIELTQIITVPCNLSRPEIVAGVVAGLVSQGFKIHEVGDAIDSLLMGHDHEEIFTQVLSMHEKGFTALARSLQEYLTDRISRGQSPLSMVNILNVQTLVMSRPRAQQDENSIFTYIFPKIDPETEFGQTLLTLIPTFVGTVQELFAQAEAICA